MIPGFFLVPNCFLRQVSIPSNKMQKSQKWDETRSTRFNQITGKSRITKITSITRFTRSTKFNRITKYQVQPKAWCLINIVIHILNFAVIYVLLWKIVAKLIVGWCQLYLEEVCKYIAKTIWAIFCPLNVNLLPNPGELTNQTSINSFA